MSSHKLGLENIANGFERILGLGIDGDLFVRKLDLGLGIFEIVAGQNIPPGLIDCVLQFLLIE